MSRILAGPFATMHLADLGADVIKVEMPGRGDETRHWGPPFSLDGTASYFLAVNRSKRSLTLDLRDRDAARIARKLASNADVVIDNFLPGKLIEFGLDHETLAKINPRLVTATISGFGLDNAYAGRPGFDFLAQAMGGMMSITGQPGGEPTRVGVAITDLLTGLFTGLGVLSALLERGETERGRHLDVSLLDAQLSSLVNIAAGWLTAGVEPGRFGNRHPSIAPYETLGTLDRPLAVAVGTDRQFRIMVEVLDSSELADDPRYATNRARIQHRDKLVALLEQRLSTHDRDYWLEQMTAAGVPVAPVNSISEVFADPVIYERAVINVGGVKQIRSPLWLDGESADVDLPPPALGEHTLAILTAMGLSAESILGLADRKVI